MIKRIFVAAIVLMAFCQAAYGQYYITGQTPARQKWLQIETDSLRMIFPREYEGQARRTLWYMEQARGDVGYGFQRGPMKTPVIFKTENFLSNGLAMLTPRRIELIGVPSTDTYANPWLKQLAVHEYRHMVQYNNINRNTVRVLSWFFGQQAPILAMGLLDFWFIEGDAVLAETQSSPFGRGLQPSFTIHYRALGEEVQQKKRNIDKWFCGSYRDYVPSHYELGYQLIAHSGRKFDKYIWGDIVNFASNYPLPFTAVTLSLHNLYKTSTNDLFHGTFGELNAHWNALPQQDDNASMLTHPVKAFTTYSYPVYVDEITIVALKEDYKDPSRFVSIDTRTGEETFLWHTGYISSRPVYADGKLWWSEYEQSLLWEQKVDSRIYSRELAERGVASNYRHITQGLYPVPAGDDTAYVKYHYDGHFSIEWEGGSYNFSHDESLHGLAWDNATKRLYYIILRDEGMWIEGMRMDTVNPDRRRVTEPSFVTVNNLTAGGGKLYFGSIYSGKDEIHVYDLAAEKEYRLSTSRFGSFSPSPSADGETVALTVYGRMGPGVASLPVESVERIPHVRVPQSVVNLPIADWDFQKTDTLIYSEAEAAASEEKYSSRRYRKGLNLFSLHSWAPLDYNPETVFSDIMNLDVRLGATLISQNLLGSAVSSLNYGYTGDGHSLVRGRFTYYGWAPKISVSASWTDRGHMVLGSDNSISVRGSTAAVNTQVYLPMVLSNSYWTSTLTPVISHTFRNNQYFNPTAGRYEQENLFYGYLQYSANTRRARLDLIPRWGFAGRVSWSGNPFSSLYTDAGSIWIRGYLPGIVRSHGLSIAVAGQKAFGRSLFAFAARELVPRGFTDVYPNKYAAVSGNYYFPIAYPEWGIPGVLFFKRITATVGVDYARYTDTLNAENDLLSYGGTLSFDVTPLRMPSASTSTVTFSLFRKNDSRNSWYFNFGVSIPL